MLKALESSKVTLWHFAVVRVSNPDMHIYEIVSFCYSSDKLLERTQH